MKTRINILIVIVLCCCAMATSAENRFRLGFQMGPFVPQDWQIQGSSYIRFDPNGNPTSVYAAGFGNGFDLLMFSDYLMDNWGIRLEWGARLLQKRKVQYTGLSGYKQTYENKFTVIPVTLSLLRFARNQGNNFTPYMGFGGGIYFANWEEKSTFDYGPSFSRTWYKGSGSPFGAHILAGLDYRIWKGVGLSLECKYSYIHSNWELKEEDSGAIIKRADINIGGASLRFGVNYGF